MPRIDNYKFGQIVVDGQTYSRDLILLPDRVVPNWWRQDGHVLRVADLEDVLETRPDVLVVGLGAFRRMRVLSETRDALEAAGVEVIELSTKRACEEYGELCEQRVVAAALHLSC